MFHGGVGCRVFATLLLFCAGCTFSPFGTGELVDDRDPPDNPPGSEVGGGDDGAGGEGGAGGALAAGGAGGEGGDGGGPAATWQVVDTLSVPSDGTAVVSTVVLDLGATYRLRASGTVVTNPSNNWRADAEYYDFATQSDTTLGVDIGIAVDDPIVDENRSPRWGPYNADHIYTVTMIGEGAPIVASYHDGNFSNNSGSFTLQILTRQ